MHQASVLLIISVLAVGHCYNLELVHAFARLNFTFPTATDTDNYFYNRRYENTMLAGLKINSKGDMFVSIPRWKDGVPATLNKVVIDPVTNKTLLNPYPSWDRNKVGDVNALQSVLGFEIDDQDRIWILDQGKVNGAAALPDSVKLVIYNTLTDEHVRTHVFSEQVAGLSCGFMNDVVIEKRANSYFAYMTDSGLPVDSDESSVLCGGLVAYSYDDNKSVRVLHQHPTTQDDRTLWFTIGNTTHDYLPDPNAVHVFDSRMRTGADGIALSCDFEWVYYTPLTSRHLYAVRTSELKKRLKGEATDINVEYAGYKYCNSDGITMDSYRNLYFSCLEQSALYVNSYAKQGDFGHKSVIDYNIMASGQHMQWPDTLAMYNGYLYFVSNQLYRFVGGSMTFGENEVNYRIYRIHTGTRSYKYGCDVAGTTESKPNSPLQSNPTAVSVLFVVAGVSTVSALALAILWSRDRKRLLLRQRSESLLMGN